MMHGDMGYRKYVPVQLFEALYLLFLFGLLFLRAKEGKRYNLSLYIIAYGIWRFVVEYLRRDYRGSISFTSLTPSQFIAVLMVIAGIGAIFLERAVCNRIEKKKAEAPKEAEAIADSVEAVEMVETAEAVEATEAAEAEKTIDAKEDENE
jgi:prolipoprotein diacylglyceryltransferase